MGQHDMVIDNSSGANVRADINNALQALAGLSSGASEPTTKYAYQLWADTTAGLLKIRNAANNAWIIIGTLASVNLGLLPLSGGTLTGAVSVPAGASGAQAPQAQEVAHLAADNKLTGHQTIQGRVNVAASVGGTVDAITAVHSPTFTAWVDKMRGTFRAGGANTSTAPTFAPDGLAAKTIVKENLVALAAGDIAGAGHEVEWIYNATADKVILLNPKAAGAVSQVLHVREEQAAGTAGGGSSAGVQARVINTVVLNEISGASLVSNQITLPAGTYKIQASAPNHYGGGNQLLLYNVTNAAYTLLGDGTYGGSGFDVFAPLVGKFTIAAPKVFELRHYIAVAKATDGLGHGHGNGNGFTEVEVYAEAFIEKVS